MVQLSDSAISQLMFRKLHRLCIFTFLPFGPIELLTMERAAAASHSPNITHFPGRDDDISTVRDVARKTFETLELNVKTCLKITKLVDAITSDQGTGLRRWSCTNSDLNLRRFKDLINSLRRKQDAWLAMRCSALESGFKPSGETYTILGIPPEVIAYMHI